MKQIVSNNDSRNIQVQFERLFEILYIWSWWLLSSPARVSLAREHLLQLAHERVLATLDGLQLLLLLFFLLGFNARLLTLFFCFFLGGSSLRYHEKTRRDEKKAQHAGAQAGRTNLCSGLRFLSLQCFDVANLLLLVCLDGRNLRSAMPLETEFCFDVTARIEWPGHKVNDNVKMKGMAVEWLRVRSLLPINKN
jgi:hypothetical protein